MTSKSQLLSLNVNRYRLKQMAYTYCYRQQRDCYDAKWALDFINVYMFKL